MNLLFRAFLLILTAVCFITATNAQITPQVRRAVHSDKTPPLREMRLIEPQPRDRSWKNGIIRNEDSGRKRNENPSPLPSGLDPALQSEFGFRDFPGMVANFEGVPNRNSVYPPDTDGDVGPNHYFQMINLSFQIFDKQGNSLYGPADNSTLWSGFIGSWTGTNDGDPILLYDEMADRWVATQFAINTSDGTYWELVALSESGDPLGAYYRYAFQFPAFNDYPKVGVWPDGYYFSFNMFGNDYRRAAVCALDREAMLNGDPGARMVLFDMPQGSEPWSLLPADFDGPPPPAGSPNYFIYAMDDAFGSGDYLSLWAFVTNWEAPENSTFQEMGRLDTEPFNSFFCEASLGACLPQPDNGPNLEVLSDRLMYRLQYRNFGTYQTMVTNHTVNADGQGHAGIRWYELRNNNDGNWFIYQQGTYAPDENDRWMASVAMDGRGYIALGFSIVSPVMYPSIRYTGRSPNDPLGQMTFFEEVIMAGTGIQTGSAARWGDYSMMSVDPADDTTFWFTTEYVKNSGQVSWKTRIAGFRMVEDNLAPADVLDLQATANTTNSITLRWTATGNDGNNGTAFLYDIRYSKVPITDENFDAAIQAENEPVPSESGSQEVFTINDLEFSTTYYLAMKVRDRQFNFTGLSNTVQALTPGKPVMAVEETAIVQKIFPGSAGAREFIIRNTGESDLCFKTQKEAAGGIKHPRNLGDYADRSRQSDPDADAWVREALSNDGLSGSRAAGDILGEYTGATSSISGMTWVGNNIFMLDMQNNLLLTYDTALQAITGEVTVHENPFSIAWDGELLWIGDNNGNITAYHPDGSSAGYSFSCPQIGYPTLSWDGEAFYTNTIISNNPYVYRVDETGKILESFRFMLNSMQIWQLAYVPEHYSGPFWFTNNNGIIGQAMVDENNTGTILQQFAAPFTISFALCHDHTDLWYGKPGGTLYRIDDGTDEVNWLTIEPGKGTVPAASQLSLALNFNAGGFDFGNKLANVTILTNDPEVPSVTLPVDMVVTGFSLGPDTSFCGHLNITLDAGEGFAGYLWSDGSTGQTMEIDSAGYGLGIAGIWAEATDIGGTVLRDSISINFLDCTDIIEFSSGLKVKIYPNPTNGSFTVESEGNHEEMLKLFLLNPEGKTMMEFEMASPGKQSFTPGLKKNGNYLLRLSSGGKTKVIKLMVI